MDSRTVGDDGPDDTKEVPSDTAGAVAYWYHRDPTMHPADIAARIGRSERTVRRHWRPTPATADNGRRNHSLTAQLFD
jgi:hypothetical protein